MRRGRANCIAGNVFNASPLNPMQFDHRFAPNSTGTQCLLYIWRTMMMVPLNGLAYLKKKRMIVAQYDLSSLSISHMQIHNSSDYPDFYSFHFELKGYIINEGEQLLGLVGHEKW